MKTAAIALLGCLPLAGCLDLFQDDPTPFARPLDTLDFAVPSELPSRLSADDLTWPDLTGGRLTILHHGAFPAFDKASARFAELTGAEVIEAPADDTGTALNLALAGVGAPEHDIIYGIDNILLAKAVDAGLLTPYTPQLAGRVAEELVFFGTGTWPATPVDHGYIALNVDSDDPLLDKASPGGCHGVKNGTPDGNATIIRSLTDVRALACLFVTQDPNTSTPGLGFLLITIDHFGEPSSTNAYDWTDYWRELFRGSDSTKCSGDEALVTAGWSEAYENHFTGGYGNADWNSAYVGGRPIVTSYTQSPAYEAYFGNPAPADVLLGQGNVFHQVQTMGILRGTPNLAIAQAWIEFTLTDDFQSLAASENAVYPAVTAVDTDDVYGDLDPEPGSFSTVHMGWRTIGNNLDAWLDTWQELAEEHGCGALG